METSIGHFGKIGPFHLYVPPAAKNLTRELGLMLFFCRRGSHCRCASGGCPQRSRLDSAPGRRGRDDAIRSGRAGGDDENLPALAAVGNQTETALPVLSYASSYPVPLIFKILLIQALIEVLRHLR